MSRRRDRNGFSIIEVLCSLSLLSVSVLGTTAMNVQALADSDAGKTRRMAVEIARDQLDYIQLLPAGQLDADGEFAPAVWIQSPGLHPGQLPTPMRGRAGADRFDVDVRVAEQGGARKYAVRVRWTGGDGISRVHELTAVRAS